MFAPKLEEDQMVPEEDKVEIIQKKNSWDQGIIWQREDR